MFGTACKQFIIFIPRLRLCLGQCVNSLLFLYRDSDKFGTVCKQFIIFMYTEIQIMFGTVCKQFIIFIPRFRLCLGQCVKNL